MAIHSMTGFARSQTQARWGTLSCEIRSVNHRYLEPSFKLPDFLRVIEPRLRESLRKQVQRGKIEIAFRLNATRSDDKELKVDMDHARRLIAAAKEIAAAIESPQAINPLEVLGWPGVTADDDPVEDAIGETALELFHGAMDDLLANREREGTEMRAVIEQRLTAIDGITAAVSELMPELLQGQKAKMQQRLADLKAQLDCDRLEQEMALLAQKADVDEELDRLKTHVVEVRRVLKKGGSCGRRLDFLMQELNREANTLSSKSLASQTTQHAVELKVLIEQMREQVQNIE